MAGLPARRRRQLAADRRGCCRVLGAAAEAGRLRAAPDLAEPALEAGVLPASLQVGGGPVAVAAVAAGVSAASAGCVGGARVQLLPLEVQE